MGVTAWQRQLLSTLTRLEGSITSLDQGFTRLEEGQREMREDIRTLTRGHEEMRGDIRTLTRVVVRRVGTAGAAAPQIGDHVLYHVSAQAVLPAVVIGSDGDRVDLEVFGTDTAAPQRFARGVSQGIASGCWSFPG